MSHHYYLWEMIKTIYFTGQVVATLFTFLMSKDKSLLIRLLAALLIGLTWPLSLPVAIVFSFF